MGFFVWLFHRRKKQLALAEARGHTITASVRQQTGSLRRFLEDSDYLLPKDAEEEYRLNFQHYALYHAIGNHYVAPLHSTPRLILDVGAGTGIWASEVAHLFPQATVLGVDIDGSLFRPEVPENCLLRTGNVLTGLPFPDQLFSYTHQRLLVAAITSANWPRVVHELVRVTRVGGWVEMVEIDNQIQNAGPATARLMSRLEQVSKDLGFDGEPVRHLGDMLTSQGLQAVEMQAIPIPVGEWGGRVGSLMKQDLLKVIEAVKSIYCQRGRIAPDEFDRMVRSMAAEWEQYHASCTFFAAFGKRVQA
ncbi:MAG TPA: methyltransferase domain-containing protein [Ktedonobacteraceae bacterium]|jgi:SAM-dependent methyltransferase